MASHADDENVISADLWRAWEAKGRQHAKATLRRITVMAGLILTAVALVVVFRNIGIR